MSEGSVQTRRARRRRGTSWSLFAVAAFGALAALTWVAASVMSLERAEAVARSAADQASVVRLALWRMDSVMTPRLAAEAARPYFHYLAFYPPRRAYSQHLTPIESGEVLTPSPLLTFRDDVVRLHVQVDSRKHVSSPQVPQDSQRDVTEWEILSTEEVLANATLLEQIRLDLGGIPLTDNVVALEACQTLVIEEATPNVAGGQRDAGSAAGAAKEMASGKKGAPSREIDTSKAGPLAPANQSWATNDYAQRLAQGNRAQTAAPLQQREYVETKSAPSDVAVVEIGTFVPLWIERQGVEPNLYYFRRVVIGGDTFVQGFMVDWPRVRELLLDEIADLLPGASLASVRHPGGTLGASFASVVSNGFVPAVEVGERNSNADGMSLASIPARLIAPIVAAPQVFGLTPSRIALGVAWGAVIAAVIAAALSLRAVLADSQRRSRFAGTVTHELRTPLTTFQLYTDLLIDDMVPASRRREYLETLQREAHRLGHLVENVLSYARIEQGRHQGHFETIAPAQLLERIEPPLRRRAEAAGFELRIAEADAQRAAGEGEELADKSAADRTLCVDVDSIERIVFNLVDNAAKYAGHDTQAEQEERDGLNGSATNGVRPTIDVRLDLDERSMRLRVIDHGPGVPREAIPRLFRAFERGADDHTQAQRGIGLGLALSRELARALGGELRHVATSGGGATFELDVPRG